MWTIKDYKWTVCIAFPPSSQPCAVSRTQAHPRHSLVSVCALWWGLFAGSAGLDLKLWCLKLVRSSVGGTLVCLGHGETQPGGSGCCSAVELAGPAWQPSWSSALQCQTCPLGIRETGHGKTQECSTAVWQAQLHIFTCRFPRAVLLKTLLEVLDSNMQFPHGLQLYSACLVHPGLQSPSVGRNPSGRPECWESSRLVRRKMQSGHRLLKSCCHSALWSHCTLPHPEAPESVTSPGPANVPQQSPPATIQLLKEWVSEIPLPVVIRMMKGDGAVSGLCPPSGAGY